MSAEPAHSAPRAGRYMLFGRVGAGGMGAVHLGRRVGPAGFSRIVAIKRLHPHLTEEREFVNSFLDEARIAARVNHPNVVSIHDVVIERGEVLLVMEYVHGRSLSSLTSGQKHKVPPAIAASIAVDMLHGLQAAHDAKDERGRPLGLVHRDVSPQNVLVGVDGVARVLDFGIAKALGRIQTTGDGSSLKGKLAYMAPERLRDNKADTVSVDVFAAAMVIWELLAGARYHDSTTNPELVQSVIHARYRHLDGPDLAEIDLVLERALDVDPANRHATCHGLAVAIERALDPASRVDVIDWVRTTAKQALEEADKAIEQIERGGAPTFALGATEEGTVSGVDAAAFAMGPTELSPVGPGQATRLEPVEVTSRTEEHSIPRPRGRAKIALLAGLVVGAGIVLVAASRFATPSAPSRASAVSETAPINVVIASAASTPSAPSSAVAPDAPPRDATSAPAPPPEPVSSANITRPPQRGAHSSARTIRGGAKPPPIATGATSAIVKPPEPEAPTDRK